MRASVGRGVQPGVDARITMLAGRLALVKWIGRFFPDPVITLSDSPRIFGAINRSVTRDGFNFERLGS